MLAAPLVAMRFTGEVIGTVGSEDNPFNFRFFGVLAAGLPGALVVRGWP